MTKEQLLLELQQDTYVMLKPSPIEGIGVFAIRDIPKGCRTIFSAGIGEWIKVSIDEVEKLPAHSRNLVETYCLYDEENYFVPDYGFKIMDLVLYLNHSSQFNMISVNDGEQFEALRDIKAGEELLVDYGSIVLFFPPPLFGGFFLFFSFLF
ncbi:MAG: SET domain-containing protein [Chitinophagaceae bacterium]|nr:SET domain-containing protein [Chitinophagaceae bacterium]